MKLGLSISIGCVVTFVIGWVIWNDLEYEKWTGLALMAGSSIMLVIEGLAYLQDRNKRAQHRRHES